MDIELKTEEPEGQCDKCLSLNTSDGVVIDTSPSIWRYQCLDCGAWSQRFLE